MNAHGQPMYSIKLSETLIKAFNKPNKTHVETKTGLVGSKVYRKVVSNRKVIGGNPKTKKKKKRRRRRRRRKSKVYGKVVSNRKKKKKGKKKTYNNPL